MEKPHIKETLNQWAVSYHKPLQLDPSTLAAYDDPNHPTQFERSLDEINQEMLAEFKEHGGFPHDYLIFDYAQPERSKSFAVVGIQQSRCQIGWINGINNTYAESKTSARYIRELAGGHAVAGVNNCTHGPVIDILEAAIFNYNGWSPNTAKLLQKQWQSFHELNWDKPHAKLLQICHSQGAIDVKNALTESPPEIRDRIIVVAIAPAAIVPKRLCFESKNYASEKDIVHKFEPTQLSATPLRMDSLAVPSLGEVIDDRNELIILKAHPEAKGIDHEFKSFTYQPILERVLAKYEEHGGEFQPEERDSL